MKFHRLYKESFDELTKDKFDELFYDYVDVADEYYCKDGYKSKNANMLKSKMKEFIDTVKSNVSRDYKRAEPDWEKYVSMVINGLDDNICDGDDDWIESKKRQLWYDFISYKPLVGANTNESSDAPVDIKKLLKMNGVTKLPAGTKFSGTKASWEKHKGHAGSNTIHKMCIQLEQAGWKKGDWTTGGIPDGSSVANRQTYTSPDGKILMSYTEYYGCTSYDNSFYITFKLVGDGLVSEGDDDDWDSDEPLVYKYHEDEPISVKEFVDKVRSEQQNIEDTFIQCSDVYENADEPWEMFCDDMCDGKSPEETFGLDYYMNKAARDQLPENIAKYVYGNDFDAMQWLRGIFEQLMPICKDPVDESTIRGTGRVDFDDDMVAVYDTKGKLEYKGLFDDCPYKDEPMQYDRNNMVYRFEGENGDYRTMVKIAESKVNEASRFGFEVGDKVVLTKDKSNRFSGDFIPAGTEGEVVAINKPMPGIIKVKIEDWKVVSVPERQLRKADEDEEPWKKMKKPEDKPKKDVKPEKPEDYYMRPTSYGSPRYTGD